MKKSNIGLIIAIVLFVAVVFWFIRGLNLVVILDENVKSTWSQVENQLQRRSDLVPNLVNTVKGYAQHEKELFVTITELRSQWQSGNTIKAKIETAHNMTDAISKLLALAENYPVLKASQNFLALQDQLEGTENRIAVERRRYNQAVQLFNSYQRTIFGSLFAKLRGLTEPAIYYEVEESAKELPKVQF